MRKVEAPKANSLVHTHIALFTWARAALTLSSLEWGLEEDAAHGCLTLFTQPTTPSSAQTCFWILVMYTECEKISDLLRFPFCSPENKFPPILLHTSLESLGPRILDFELEMPLRIL